MTGTPGRTVELSLERIEPDYRAQIEYALSFASEDVEGHSFRDDAVLVLRLKPKADETAVRYKVNKLLERYTDRKFGLKEVVHFRQEKPGLKPFDAYAAMVDAKWITPVGVGHVVLRGPAARLMRAIDQRVVQRMAPLYGAEHEIYPQTIQCKTLDRIAHFTSFPEHIDFVSHLREDVDVLGAFAKDCKDRGWAPGHHEGRMSAADLAICPSCCYHCYEAMEGWELPRSGRAVTAVLNCHRYEAGNLTTLSRLRSFHMREVVFVGHPEYVRECRRRLDELILGWAKDWEVDCTFENANDMFFTDDYAVKASFQRQQEAKRELRLLVPQESKRIACASNNFHATTFGKAFNITCEGRPVASACLGVGLERLVYAVISQCGMDPSRWPEAIRADVAKYAPETGR